MAPTISLSMSEETYSFLCPSCSAHLSVPVSVAGVSGPCPYCASTITSPMPDQVPLEDLIAIEDAAASEAAEQYETTPQPEYAPPVAPEQPWNAPTTAADSAAEVSTVEAKTSAIPEPKTSGRKKRGERVPKGKQGKQRKRSEAKERQPQSQRREEAKPRPQESRGASAATVVDAPPSKGLSLFAKACLGITGVALVALGAVYGLPAIMGKSDDKPEDLKGGDGSALLNPSTAQPVKQVPSDSIEDSNVPDPVIPEPRIVNTPEERSSAPASLPDAPDMGSDPSPAVGSTDTKLPESMTSYTPAADSILVKPRQTLEAFLAAPNWRERIKFVTGGQAMASEMRSYYAQYPDGPLDPVSINWTLNDKDPDGTEIFVFTTSFDVEGEDGIIYLDFPTVVEATKGKYTVNWRSFVEFKDRHLNEFITKRAFNKPQNFHVIALRSHFFGSDPELKSKVESGEFVCVKVNSPNPDDQTQAFLSTRNKSAKDMAASLAWEKAAGGHFDTPLLELCWKKTSSGTPYVEITKVLGDKWRDTPK